MKEICQNWENDVDLNNVEVDGTSNSSVHKESTLYELSLTVV